MKHFIFAAIAACATSTATAADPASTLTPNRNIPLWNGPAPGALGEGPLDAPFLTVFTPRESTTRNTRTRGAVIIAPGGGNIMLMYGGEGAEVAEVFNDWGVTAFVLTYCPAIFSGK